MGVGKTFYKPLIAGIDTLEIGYCISEFSLTEQEWEEIENAKVNSQATAYEKGIAIIFHGFNLTVLRSGSPRYKYILSNEDFDICIFTEARKGSSFPEIKVRFKSQFLWRNGWIDAVKKIDKWLRTWADVSEVKISRIDITVDFLGPFPVLSPELKEVVTRGKHKREYGNYERYSQGKRQNGYKFGANDILCRIYNKTLEILHSEKKWFEDLWSKQGYKKGDEVTRVEFQCRRRIIKRLQIKTIDDLFLIVPDLWRYLTCEWMTIRIVQDDSHRTRWPISSFWLTVQGAVTCFGEVTGVSLLRQLIPKKEILERQGRGLILSIGALASKSLAGSDIKYGKRYLRYIFNKWLNDPNFDSEIEKRRHKYDNTEY
jgi:hypothetical protein